MEWRKVWGRVREKRVDEGGEGSGGMERGREGESGGIISS